MVIRVVFDGAEQARPAVYKVKRQSCQSDDDCSVCLVVCYALCESSARNVNRDKRPDVTKAKLNSAAMLSSSLRRTAQVKIGVYHGEESDDEAIRHPQNCTNEEEKIKGGWVE